MGMSISGAASARGRRRRKRSQPMSEINVTPFVDVMLVLLIIFMVTAPLLTVGVPIELPKTKAEQISASKEALTITVNRKGQFFLQENEIELDKIAAKLIAITKNGYKEQIYVRGDHHINYGTVMQLMGRINAAGFKRVALVTDVEEAK